MECCGVCKVLGVVYYVWMFQCFVRSEGGVWAGV
jgi:hypothetical protein